MTSNTFRVLCAMLTIDLDNQSQMRHMMRKPAFRILVNKGVDQLCGNRTSDLGLCSLHRWYKSSAF